MTTPLEEGAAVRVMFFAGTKDATVLEDRGDEIKIRCGRKIHVVPRHKVLGADRTVHEHVEAKAPKEIRMVDARPRARPHPKMSPPARSEHFMAFVREWPCCACSAPGPSDPHHFGRHGMGQKTDDFRCVPLCRRCHDAFHDTNALPGMDKASTKLFFLQRQVDTLVAYLKHLDNTRREARTE